MTGVAVVGAGLSGLACARALQSAGVECAVYDAADAVGGRVRTWRGDGFQVDRGFQVLLTAYPEARRVLDYDALDLRPFTPGALVHLGGGFERVGDPLRRPLQALPSLVADVGSLADKLRVLRLRQSVTAGTVEALWQRPETTTEQALRERYGFSDVMVDRFFRPFLGGVLLDRSLSASSRVFEFYFRCFSRGQAAVPAAGMQAIPEQLADRLAPGTVRLGAEVEAVSAREVQVGGEAVRCRAVVVATDAAAAGRLLNLDVPPSKGTVQIAWAADAAPTDEPILMLDGDGAGPVNNVQVMSAVAPGYAPPGRALITASVLGHPAGDDLDLDAAARSQLHGWFGDQVDGWRPVRVDRVPHALPDLPSLSPPERPARLAGAVPGGVAGAVASGAGGLYVTGDWRRNGSINGALVAGRHAAEAVLADLGAPA